MACFAQFRQILSRLARSKLTAELSIVNRILIHPRVRAKATDKVGTGSNDLRQPAEGLYLGSEDWVIERLVWVGNV